MTGEALNGPAAKPVVGAVGALELSFVVDNYPNPFNPDTVIRFALAEAAEVQLVIYNSLGQQIRVLMHTYQLSGIYDVRWNGRDDFGREVGAGVYLYRLQADGQAIVGKMVLLK